MAVVKSDGPAFQPVQPASLAESILVQVRRAIINGDLLPEERLLEIQLAEQFEVSRATIRQALVQLGYEGLVEIRPRRGAVVTRMSIQAAYEVCVVRGLLEGWAARTACMKLTDAQLSSMRDAARQMGTCLGTGDMYGLAEADVAFHYFICECDENTLLSKHWQSSNTLHGALMASHLAVYNYDPDGVTAMHENLCDVLARRDPEEAEQAVRLHYMRARGSGEE